MGDMIRIIWEKLGGRDCRKVGVDGVNEKCEHLMDKCAESVLLNTTSQ